MSPTLELVNILGAAALLLWGLGLIKTGVMNAFGASLRQWIARGTKNRVSAAFWGFFATLALQSSTAIAVITASFVTRDFITLAMAQAVMLGANLGTAIVALVLSTDISAFGSLIILIGVATAGIARKATYKGLGRAVIGLGLMLLALQLMDKATTPLRESPLVAAILAALDGAPVLAVLVASVLAVISSSSLAVIVLAVVLAGGNVISPVMSVYMVAGANLGGALPAYLAVLAEGSAARRLTLANLIVRGIGALFIMSLAHPIAAAMTELAGDPRQLPAVTHIIFNAALLLIFLPLIGPVNHLVRRLLPGSRSPDETGPRYLDKSLLDMPELALASATRETLRLGDMVGEMLDLTMAALIESDDDNAARIHQLEVRVDAVHEAIKFYVSELMQTDLSDAERKRAEAIITYAINLEHAGDIVENGLAGRVFKKTRNRLTLSDEGRAELQEFFKHTAENLRLAQAIFLSRDLTLARNLIEAKVTSRHLEEKSIESHLKRLRQGRAEAMETSSIHMDILRDLKRINAHFASVAYPILDESSLLTDSRMISGSP